MLNANKYFAVMQTLSSPRTGYDMLIVYIIIMYLFSNFSIFSNQQDDKSLEPS